MKTLIIGRNEVNTYLSAYLTGEGIDTTILEDISDLLQLKGEPGAYTAAMPDGLLSFTSVIVTEPPQICALEVDGQASARLLDGAETQRLFDPKQNGKVVILLDYGEETPEYITTRAITLAARLAENKKDVLFLSRFVKSGHAHGEERYIAARNAGVSFVKYDEVRLHYDADMDLFRIGVWDGVSARGGAAVLNIETPYLVTAVCAETPALEAISKKLRIRRHRPGGQINDRFFLHRTFTTRRGIYYYNPALETPDPARGIPQAMQPVVRDMLAACADGYTPEIVRAWSFPEVDAGKCAFCYSCYRACPHGALAPDMAASAMMVVESLCQSCGICAAICPGEAITRKASAGTAAAADKPKSRCKIYLCENGAARAFEEFRSLPGARCEMIDSVTVACGGNVSADMLTRDLADYEVVVIAACMPDACRHLDGDKRARKQAGRAAELLKEAGISGKRVHVIHTSHAMPGVLRDRLEEILEEIK